jgi:hypothetical protein
LSAIPTDYVIDWYVLNDVFKWNYPLEIVFLKKHLRLIV